MKTVPYEHKVQYYETDKMGIVHHSNYIRWFEEARIDFMEQAGISYEQLEQKGLICPVISVECKYRGMTKFGERVSILPKIEKFNGIRLVISYEIRDTETGELRCTGKSSHCYLNEKGKPANLKTAYRDCYEMFLRYME